MIVTTPSGERFVVFRLGDKEDDIIEQVFTVTLGNNGGNITKTARALGLCIRTVRSRMIKYGLREPKEEE